MSVDELKKEAATLSSEKQGELAAFLVSLRNARNPDYVATMRARMEDKDAGRWLTPDQFDRRLASQ